MFIKVYFYLAESQSIFSCSRTIEIKVEREIYSSRKEEKGRRGLFYTRNKSIQCQEHHITVVVHVVCIYCLENGRCGHDYMQYTSSFCKDYEFCSCPGKVHSI